MIGLLFLGMVSRAAADGRCAALEVRETLTCSSVIQGEITLETANRLSGPYACPQQLLQSGGEHIYGFSCQKDGPVQLLIEDLACDLDIYVLDESCDTRQGCVGESVAGSSSQDRVHFTCREGVNYTVVIEGFGFQDLAMGRCDGERRRGTYTLRFDVSDATGGCVENCSDGADNDRDGAVDCADGDCAGEAGCASPEPVIDVTRLPRLCYTGRACGGETTADRGAQLVVGGGGQRLASGEPPAVVPVSTTYASPGEQVWTVYVLDAGGQTLATKSHTVDVVEPLHLAAPPVLDFGTVPAGTATFGAGHCQTLDLSGSTGLDAHLFSLTWSPPAGGGCQAEPVLRGGRADRPRATRLPLAGFSLGSSAELCLAVPRCAGEAVQGATLTIAPQDPAWASAAAVVELRWSIAERSWLACNWWWLALVAATLLVLWVVVGIIRPARFPPQAAIAVAGSEKGMRRAVPQRLRELRGSRAGFYRDAQLGIHGDGSVNGRLRGAILVLRAHRQRGLILRGPVEMLDRRSRQWVAPEDLKEGHTPSPATLYRAGDLWFRIEL